MDDGRRQDLEAVAHYLRAELTRVETELAQAEAPAQGLIEFYQERAEKIPHSSEDDDQEALLAAGFRVSRECVRALRVHYAPRNWRKPGRRKGTIA